jgi:CopG family transcriptional regulator, nickel-responsive regulator
MPSLGKVCGSNFQSAVEGLAMERVTVSLDDRLTAEFDALVEAQGYANRSEAVRDLMRHAVEARRQERGTGPCVANLSYIFHREERALAARLSELEHAHHDLVITSTYVHLDHEHSLASVLLRGSTPQVRAFADRVQSERGVRFGSLNLITVDVADRHTHSHGQPAHTHLTPKAG